MMAGTGVMAGLGVPVSARAASKELVYLTPGLDLPFWRYLSKGIESVAKKEGYGFQALDSHNSAQTQLHNAQDAIARGVAGIIISPTDSSTAPSVLELAQKANIPVVIADIGTNSGEYVSFIISDNYEGAHGVGEALAAAMKKKGWDDASFGIVAISQARKNGQARTKGFMDAMQAAGLTKRAGLQQMQSYTADETFKFTQDMITANPGMRGLFVQTDQPAIGALRAIKAARKEGEILVAAFDGIPEFVDLIQSGKIVVSGMQQPFLMGVRSGEAMVKHLKGEEPEKEILVPILVVTSENIEKLLPTVKETVFANEMK
jgi:ABC-type sugar transport system substrate-binding protein